MKDEQFELMLNKLLTGFLNLGSLLCFVLLAIYFDNWALVLLEILFWK